jgi:hypothetical protein
MNNESINAGAGNRPPVSSISQSSTTGQKATAGQSSTAQAAGNVNLGNALINTQIPSAQAALLVTLATTFDVPVSIPAPGKAVQNSSQSILTLLKAEEGSGSSSAKKLANAPASSSSPSSTTSSATKNSSQSNQPSEALTKMWALEGSAAEANAALMNLYHQFQQVSNTNVNVMQKVQQLQNHLSQLQVQETNKQEATASKQKPWQEVAKWCGYAAEALGCVVALAAAISCPNPLTIGVALAMITLTAVNITNQATNGGVTKEMAKLITPILEDCGMNPAQAQQWGQAIAGALLIAATVVAAIASCGVGLYSASTQAAAAGGSALKTAAGLLKFTGSTLGAGAAIMGGSCSVAVGIYSGQIASSQKSIEQLQAYSEFIKESLSAANNNLSQSTIQYMQALSQMMVQLNHSISSSSFAIASNV